MRIRTAPDAAAHPCPDRRGMRKQVISGIVGLFTVGAVLAVGTAAGAQGKGDKDETAVVRTDYGFVSGTVTPDHRIFQGIPYAAPPSGDLRLRAPRQPASWDGIRDATRRMASCPQTYVWPEGTPPKLDGAEDCLYLNLHVPRGVKSKLPVMVFLHGGNSGSGSQYDPRRITGQGDVIVVTINYRLGALGFLRHDSLSDPYAGNFALADQQAALRWVRGNIGAFGGDSRNVTLWGESYGGFSVCAQLASPAARGLFDKAVVQSASCGNNLVTRAEADRRGRQAVESLGCAEASDVAACLRALPVERIAELPNSLTYERHIADAMPWFYTAGTDPLPLQPIDAARVGIGNRVPLLQGGTRDEMRGVVADLLSLETTSLTGQRYRQIVADFYGDAAQRVIDRYPVARYGTPSLALATLQTDEGRAVGTCTQLSYNDAHNRRAPVFAYEFAEDSGDVKGDLPLGASHGDDIPLFFDSYWGAAASASTPEGDLSTELIQRWTSFAHNGRPGWAPYRRGNALTISSQHIGPVDVARTHQCGFWRTVN